MSKKFLGFPALSLFLFLFISISSFGQSIRFSVERAAPAEDTEYRKQFKAYSLGSLDTKATSDLLRSKGSFDNLKIEIQGKTYVFRLYPNDLRADNFKLRVQDETGIHEMPNLPNVTYAGYTRQGNYDVRITSDEGFFNALIVQPNDEFYIQPARDIVPSAPVDQYVMYWGSDNLKKMNENSCLTKDLPPQFKSEEKELLPDGHLNTRSVVCKTVQIALADDHLMFNKYGSVAGVNDHNMAVINNVLTNYDDEFSTDLEFDVVEIFVATTVGNDPWPNSTDPNVLLDAFTDWAPTGFSNTHDVGSLWTNRDFTGDVIGLAWIASICTPFRYNTLQDFSNNANLLRVLQAHEMGHGFSANHDAANSGFIMAPSVSNTNQWSPLSLSTINAYIPTLGCLSTCAPAQPPVANFDADQTEGCTPFVVHFLDQSSNNPTSWLWTFPGGTPGTSMLQFPTVTYNTPGTYNVTLKATNAQGNNTITKVNFITVGVAPVADFDYTQNQLSVDFDNLSLNANSYLWNFGDGATSTQTNPIHVYDEDGVYTVSLTATNDCGFDNYVIQIEIITLPIAAFDADPTEGCDPMEVEFINNSSSNADSYQWSFPGGSPPSSTAFEPIVVYETPGTYNVTLTVSNQAGDDVLTYTNFIHLLPQANSTFTQTVNGLQVSFNSTGSLGDTYNWNFGDGQTSTLHNPVHTYASGGVYTVTLTVTNQCGADVQQTNINLAGAPVALFTSDIQAGCAPLVVHYTNQSTGNVTSVNWVFEGGTPPTSTQLNPVVTYNTPGLYDVTLTVSNGTGSDDLVIQDYINVLFPTVSDFDFTVNGSQASFINQSTHDNTSLWNFGDGQTSTFHNPVHTYNADGVYTVTLISTGNCGSDTSTAQVTIATPPVANFVYQQSGDCEPVVVQYTNQSSSNTTSVQWSFPGGSPSTSSQFNPLVSYSNPGTYNATLIAYSNGGSDTVELTQIVNVGESTNAAFLISTDAMTVTMQNQSTGASSYLWLFGDGETSTETNPVHTYNNFGTYTITLITSNVCGSDTMSIIIELSTVPNASFGYDVHTGCLPLTVHFIDQSQNNPTSWLWTFDGAEPATSTDQNPTVTYSTPGNYTVSLRVENTQGSDVLVLMDLINVAGTPDASFTNDVMDNIVALFYPGTDYDSLHWDFGDGRTDDSLNPTVEYKNPGQYVISLTLYNACGTDTESIVVNIQGTATTDVSDNIFHWQLRPNPFKDKFMIYGEPLKDGKTTITLMDLNGKMISTEVWDYSSGSTSKEIRADQLPSGIILVQLQDETTKIILKGVHQDY
jgi:PKD repeat protein